MREASGKPPMQSLTETKPGEPLPFGEQLRRLEQLHAEGFITEDEFTAIRKRIIDSFGTTA
ncbi:MAG: hypothetical protein JWO94_3697 [Verrucomicrobiaceae bacterium]|nr:hypothetical protein [Verrucomicrobiaceae bacterium]